MNSITLIGRLATDVDMQSVTGGSPIASFILAVDRNAEEADFFRVKAWDSQAEAVTENLVKGRRIAVEGSPGHRLAGRRRRKEKGRQNDGPEGKRYEQVSHRVTVTGPESGNVFPHSGQYQIPVQ